MIAMLSGRPDVVEALIAAGADVNVRSPSGWTALTTCGERTSSIPPRAYHEGAPAESGQVDWYWANLLRQTLLARSTAARV
jgi:Ankyrin repeats (many copies)